MIRFSSSGKKAIVSGDVLRCVNRDNAQKPRFAELIQRPEGYERDAASDLGGPLSDLFITYMRMKTGQRQIDERHALARRPQTSHAQCRRQARIS